MSTVAILQYDDVVVRLVNDPTKSKEIWQFAEKYAGKEPEIPDVPFLLPRKNKFIHRGQNRAFGKGNHNIL